MFSAPGLNSQEGLPSLDGDIQDASAGDNNPIKIQIQSHIIF
jgi:hypothetical protein